MARDLTSGMQTSVAAESGRQVVRLLELVHSGGTVRWTTAAQDISWDGQTWTAIGGALSIGGTTEHGRDLRVEGIPAVLSGVDGSIISIVMSNHFRGREVTVWRAHLSDGAIVADPLEEFRGFQNTTYRIEDAPSDIGGGPGGVTVRTRWVSRLALLNRRNSVRTNVHSHRDMLRRAGLTGTALDDSIMKHLPSSIEALRNLRWGSETPPRLSGGGGTRMSEQGDEMR